MEFNVKLQELRRQKGLTQEELAQELFVSRTAISKWESGRGYPSIDSLKSIAHFFSISIDDLLSNEELLFMAEKDSSRSKHQWRDLLFGLLDVSSALLLFLPFFAQKVQGTIQEVSLLSLTYIAIYVKVIYYIVVSSLVLFGVITLTLQNIDSLLWIKIKDTLSVLLSAASVIIFIVSLQPYAAVFSFALLIIKVIMLLKTK